MRLKLKTQAKFLAAIFDGLGTKARKDGFATYIDLDYSQFGFGFYDATQIAFLGQNQQDGSFTLVTPAHLLTQSQSIRVIESAGPVNIAATDGLIILKKTVAENTDFNLPADGVKIGPVKIVDWNGIADSYTLRAVPSGSEKINGQSSWQLGGAYGSLTLTPTQQGLGYAL